MENSKKRQRKRRSKKSGSSKKNADYKLKRQCALHSFFSYRRSEVVKQEDYPVEDIQQSFFATCKKTNYAYCFGCIRQLYVTTRSRIRDEASLISLSSSCPQYKFWEDVYNSRVAVATNGCITIPPDACICCRPTYPPLVETTVSYESIETFNDTVDCCYLDLHCPTTKPTTEVIDLKMIQSTSAIGNSNSIHQQPKNKESASTHLHLDGAMYIPSIGIIVNFKPGIMQTHVFGEVKQHGYRAFW